VQRVRQHRIAELRERLHRKGFVFEDDRELTERVVTARVVGVIPVAGRVGPRGDLIAVTGRTGDDGIQIGVHDLGPVQHGDDGYTVLAQACAGRVDGVVIEDGLVVGSRAHVPRSGRALGLVAGAGAPIGAVTERADPRRRCHVHLFAGQLAAVPLSGDRLDVDSTEQA
jgi:hypothetical protein